jgi:hypothetical protein
VAAGEEAPAAVPTVRIHDVLGVPLWWERTAPVGPRSFPVATSFVPVLERTVRAVLNRAPVALGGLERISTAGLFVDKGGAHGLGRACDWDRLVFENVAIAPRDGDHAAASLPKRRRYWAFAALCRSVAAHVLHGHYNAPHRDHVHADDTGPFPFQAGSRASVTLVQAILNDVFGQSPRLSIDGAFGPLTRGALSAALARLQLEGIVTDPAVWQRFLRRSGRLGFVLSVRS